MRLFIAINFAAETKDRLWEVSQGLQSYALKGNFTPRENLHLTLVFLGETARVATVREAMDSVAAPAFTLRLGGLGRFPRRGGDICWVGVDRNEVLLAIHAQLCTALAKSGFRLEERAYKPHLTLGREVVLAKDFLWEDFAQGITPMKVEVAHISLMKSERLRGKLTYTEIYTGVLGNGREGGGR